MIVTSILVLAVGNALALTIPISVRIAFLVGDWIDQKLDEYQRKT